MNPNQQNQTIPPTSTPPTPIVPQPKQPTKTPLIIGIVVLILILAVGSVIVLNQGKKKSTANSSSTSPSTAATTNNSSNFSAASVKACDAFTITEAQSILGSSAKAASINGITDADTANLAISSCGYQLVNGSSVTTANVQITGALTQKGQTANSAAYAAQKSKDGGATITGIGDQAFYDGKVNTLVFLKSSYYVIITDLSETDGGTIYNQNQTEQIAKAIVEKL